MVLGSSFDVVEAVRALAGDVGALREVVALLGERLQVLEAKGEQSGQGNNREDHIGGADVDHNVAGDPGVSRDGRRSAVRASGKVRRADV